MSIFVKCRMCGIEIPAEAAKKCVFASHKTVIEGKEYLFCCARCAEIFKERRRISL